MKKSILAVAGLAAAAGVVAPMGAAFAEGNYHDYKDTLEITVAAECSVKDKEGETEGASPVVTAFSSDMDLSTTKEFLGSAAESGASEFSVVCNDVNTVWTLKAVGAGTAGHETDLWDSEGSNAIATTAGEPTTATSAWAFRMTGTSGDGLTLSNTSWSAIPSAATQVATGTGEKSFNRDYKVSISDTQAPGTYNGAVLYQLTNTN